MTNGYITADMLETFRPYLDAANVDLKAYRDKTYRQYVGARLQPVLDTMKRMKTFGIWLEVTTLVIPKINDDSTELRDAAQFVAQELGPDTPWHISRFFPAYKMNDVPATPVEPLHQAREIGLAAGLKYVDVGNVSNNGSQNTVCPGCGRVLIKRCGSSMLANAILDGCCPQCGSLIAGVGMDGYNFCARWGKK